MITDFFLWPGLEEGSVRWWNGHETGLLSKAVPKGELNAAALRDEIRRPLNGCLPKALADSIGNTLTKSNDQHPVYIYLHSGVTTLPLIYFASQSHLNGNQRVDTFATHCLQIT